MDLGKAWHGGVVNQGEEEGSRERAALAIEPTGAWMRGERERKNM